MKPLIFIHGFKGSRLTSPSGQDAWLTGAIALGLRTPPLALPARYADARQPQDGIAAAGPLDRVTVIPGLVEEKVYGPWLARLQASGRPWRAFAYDWRRDNHENAERFAEYVRDVRKQFGGSPVDIVAHSMGSLITLAALHDGVEGVERVLFAGAPFRGGVGFLDDMHAGTSTGLNAKVLSPEVLATFPSVYPFFPLRGAKLLDSQGRSADIDLFDASAWKQNRLGVYRAERGVTPEFDAFLAETLARAKKFRQRLETPVTNYPELSALVGTGRPTLAAIRRKDKSGGGVAWDVKGGERADGDGRVCAEHAVPPEGIPYRLYQSGLEHGALLNDPLLSAFLGNNGV